MKLKTVIKE